MFDSETDKSQSGNQRLKDEMQQAHKLEAYLNAFRPVLTETEIRELEERIHALRSLPEGGRRGFPGSWHF